MSISNNLFLLLIVIIIEHQLNINCLKNIDKKSSDSDNSKLLNLITQPYEKQRIKRAAISNPDQKWPHGIIPYEINSDVGFTERQLSIFKNAMKHWQNKTCIKFVERDPAKHQDYIFITEKPCNCCSLVGKIGGRQDISLSIICAKFGIVVHELGHIIGFWHEHTRPDRDRNVRIILSNIIQDKLHNFDAHNSTEIDSLGSPYDFNSIMHYARNNFAKNDDLNTIVPRDNSIDKISEIGQRIGLSKQDIIQANLLYKCPTNGQTIQEPKGTIELNEDLEMNKAEKDQYYYEWRIYASSLSERIKFRFKEINFRYFDDFNCDENYLLILDGYQLNSPILKKICVNTVPSLPFEINSETNRVIIIYKKSKQNNAGSLNLKIDYEFICGGNLNSNNGILQSANYPLVYPPNVNCEWSIKVEPNHKIVLNFTRFDLESSLGCKRDYLEIRDGQNENSNLIGRYCGSIFQVPNQIQTTSNELFLKFVSDEEINKTGFNITYSTDLDECEQKLDDCDQICINELNGYRCECFSGYELDIRDQTKCLKTCGGVIDLTKEEEIESPRKLNSPNYPNNYPNNLNCRWEFKVPINYNLYFNFTDFDVEERTDCLSDSLTLRSKSIQNNLLIDHGIYCGQKIPGPILSDSNLVFIDFKTDRSDTRRGFSLDYMLDKNECSINNGGCEHFCENKFNGYECNCQKGYLLESNKHKCELEPCKQIFTASKGSFRSINFRNSNITHFDCVYRIDTLPGHLIKIKITLNNIIPIKSNCLTPNLILYDGLTSNDKILYKFRDDNEYKIILSNTNSLFMTYYSTPECYHPGFHASYINVCGGKYTATNEQQYIYSHPEFGNSTYKASKDCKWTIKSKHSKYIRIRFLVFDLEDSDNGKCVFDNLMIYDGNNEDSSKLIATFCGNRLPNQTISLSSSLVIKFTTDDTRNRNGFVFIYDEVDGNDLIEYSV